MSDPSAGASSRGRAAHQFFSDLQARITDGLSSVDGATFTSHDWARDGGGGGRTMVSEGGRLFEKGGVDVFSVFGALSDAAIEAVPGAGRRFFATGARLAVHSHNPHVPAAHLELWLLEREDGTAWFGGGADLAPAILYEEDARDFHRGWQDVCDRHDVADHARFKAQADEHFFIPHRAEARGLGGIFFDHLGVAGDPPADLDAAFGFVRDVGGSWLEGYLPIAQRRADTPGADDERAWQLLRRGRSVEFALVSDRGTAFGLELGARPESLLVGLPSLVAWSYEAPPTPDSYQSRLVEALRTPRDWLA